MDINGTYSFILCSDGVPELVPPEFKNGIDPVRLGDQVVVVVKRGPIFYRSGSMRNMKRSLVVTVVLKRSLTS